MRIGKISPAPTPQEVAAITTALTMLETQRTQTAAGDGAQPRDHLDAWVEASRRSAQRAALQRGPWRLSGRIGRRSRA